MAERRETRARPARRMDRRRNSPTKPRHDTVETVPGGETRATAIVVRDGRATLVQGDEVVRAVAATEHPENVIHVGADAGEVNIAITEAPKPKKKVEAKKKKSRVEDEDDDAGEEEEDDEKASDDEDEEESDEDEEDGSEDDASDDEDDSDEDDADEDDADEEDAKPSKKKSSAKKDEPKKSKKSGKKKAEDAAKKRRRLVPIIAAAVVVVLAGILWFWHASHYEDTDDAQVDAHISNMAPRVSGTVVAVHVEENQPVEVGTPLVDLDDTDLKVAVARAEADLAQAEAQLRADEVNVPITTTTNTTLVSTSGTDVASAQAGISEAQRQEAQTRSQLEDMLANEEYAQREATRARNLFNADAISRAELDQKESAARSASANVQATKHAIEAAQRRVDEQVAGYKAAVSKQKEAAENGPKQIEAREAQVALSKANVDAARTQLEQAKLNVTYAHIVSPVKGIVGKRSAEVGAHVAAGQQLMSLTQTDDIWITANFRETQLELMKPGQEVEVHIDTLDKDFKGKVESFAGATGSRYSVLPPENATGNFVKVVQRLPVRIRLDQGQEGMDKLRPGMNAEPKVTVK